MSGIKNCVKSSQLELRVTDKTVQERASNPALAMLKSPVSILTNTRSSDVSLQTPEKRTKILICILTIAMIVALVFYGFWVEFQAHYLGVMKDLNSFEAKAYMLDKINGAPNFTELLSWTNQHLNWSEENFARHSSPQEILDQGKGKCEEFAIVYVSACLALGYEARIVVARQFYLGPLYGFHVWAEVKWNGVWTQTDPSPTPFWNDTSRYKNWNWGPRVILMVSAFEDNRIEDVSARYR